MVDWPARQFEPGDTELGLEAAQAVHCVAAQVVYSTIPKTVMIWPQRIFVADTSLSVDG